MGYRNHYLLTKDITHLWWVRLLSSSRQVEFIPFSKNSWFGFNIYGFMFPWKAVRYQFTGMTVTKELYVFYHISIIRTEQL